MKKSFLNIAAGKFLPLRYDRNEDRTFLVNVDRMYHNNLCSSPGYIDTSWNTWKGYENLEFYTNLDIFEFMERTIINFEEVSIYRYLEHVSFTQVLYFIYLLSTATIPGSIVDVIVPNYKILAEMILEEDITCPEFEIDNILLTTELLNEPSCPHASIWTPERIKYYFEYEGRFKTQKMTEQFSFDGRDIYLRAILERE